MKVLIYGAGPIGRWLSVRLHEVEKDVTLLARDRTYDSLWLPEWVTVSVFKRFFRSRFVEVAIGLHASAVGDEIMQMMAEFSELKQKTGLKTPYLDELMTAVPR